MAHLPILLNLANDLGRLSFTRSPFYESPPYNVHHPACMSFVNSGDQTHPLRLPGKKTAGPISTIGKDGFQVCLEVQQFKPSELSVKVVDNCVIVEGKHEEREDDHGYIARHFVRRYALPKGYDDNKVVSTLSSDGVLTVSVPKPQIEKKSNERQIQIQQVGPAHLNVKETANEEKPKEVGDTDKAQAEL